MPKILVFSRDPGGANAIIPLIRTLRERGHELLIYGKDMALGTYRNNGIEASDLAQELDNINIQTLEQFLVRYGIEALLTGTSADDATEKFLWKAAEGLNLPSVAVLDTWINYGIRFSPYFVSDLEQYERDRKHPYLPTLICVLDTYAREQMLKDGVPAERIVVTGQPYFDALLKRKRQGQKLGSRGADDPFRLTFISQPFSVLYPVDDPANSYWGYNEQSIFDELLETLEMVAPDARRSFNLVLRLHPKDRIGHFESLVKAYSHPKISLSLDKDTPVWDLLEAADLVCGMTSALLVEAVVLGKPVLSIQIGLKRENPFILSVRGVAESVLTREQLVRELKAKIFSGESPPPFEVVENAVENVANTLEQAVCRALQPQN